MGRIRTAVVGVGNCASALVQGIAWYRSRPPEVAVGLSHWDIGGYGPDDIDIVAAFDIDARKVGRDVADAIFAPPNCTTRFCRHVPATRTTVCMGPVLDGVSEHMAEHDESRRFVISDAAEPDEARVVQALRNVGAEVLVNYLPVGAQEASAFYARCALRAGVAFVNAIPVFIVSDPGWAQRFHAAGLPAIGDDIKAQLGATITHRALTEMFARRGVTLDRTYQLNTGGNTDFLNMLNHARVQTKRTSKTEAVQSVAASRMSDDDIHIGPSDYVPWQHDQKVAFIRMEGRIFGDVPVNLELRLSVEDSPNSAGVAIDAIRCCKLARDRGHAGVVQGPAACFCKHPPEPVGDELAWRMTEAFIAGESDPGTDAAHPEEPDDRGERAAPVIGSANTGTTG